MNFSTILLLILILLFGTAISYYFKIIAHVLDCIERQRVYTIGNRDFWYFIVLFFNIFGVVIYYATQRKHLR